MVHHNSKRRETVTQGKVYSCSSEILYANVCICLGTCERRGRRRRRRMRRRMRRRKRRSRSGFSSNRRKSSRRSGSSTVVVGIISKWEC